MKRRLFQIVICITAVLFVVGFLLMTDTSVEANNTMGAEELIRKEYTLKDLLVLKATAEVYLGFDCTVGELADDCGIKLECKRQTSDTSFYYIVQGSGYRCFLFADETDKLTDVIVSRGFISQQAAQELIQELAVDGNLLRIDEVGLHDMDGSYALCCRASGSDYLYFPLSDGMMIMHRPHLGHDEPPEYFFYGNEEIIAAKEYWRSLFSTWDWSSEILEIDREF